MVLSEASGSDLLDAVDHAAFTVGENRVYLGAVRVRRAMRDGIRRSPDAMKLPS